MIIEQPVKTVFLDRDGVICENRKDYVKSWDEFSFIAGAKKSIRLLTQSNFKLIIVTNQSAINRGILTASEATRINLKMVEELEKEGGMIEDVLMCPHRPEGNCNCRKPKPGLLKQAAGKFNLDYGNSYMIGDAITDVLAGQAISLNTVLVLTGLGRPQIRNEEFIHVRPSFIARDLTEAVEWILQQQCH